MTPSLIKKISLTFFLGGSCFFKPAFSSDDPSDVSQPPIAGYAAQVNHPTLHLPKTPPYYQNLLWKRKQAEEEFQKIIEETLNAAPDVIYELKHKIKEKKERLSLPEEFLKECVEALDLLTKGQPDDLAAFLDTSKLTPLQEALNYLKEFQEKWEVISSHVNSLTLALDQSLQDQKAWDALFNQENLTTIEGHDLYHWFAAFQKTLMALHSATSHFSQIWGSSYHPLFGKKNVLTNFYSAKNALLWELGKAFIGALPDYNDSLIHSELSGGNPLLAYPPKEPLETEWVLKSKFYSAWFDYFTHMNDYPPAFIDLPEMSDADKETGRRLFAKISTEELLEKEEENTLHPLCKNVIKDLWDPWKASMQKLSVLSDDALLGTLYPQEEPNKSYAFLLQLLKFIELWNQPIQVPDDLRPKLQNAFSFSSGWQETVTAFKTFLKPFTNTRFITSLFQEVQTYCENFQRKYQPDFEKGYGLPPFLARCTFRDGKRLIAPQSSACKAFPNWYQEYTIWPHDQQPALIPSLFPSIDIFHSPQDIAGRSAFSLLATLFGLPTLSFEPSFFENILMHQLPEENTLLMKKRLDVNLSQKLPIPEMIDAQRKIRAQEWLKEPERWPLFSKNSFTLIQEKFTGSLLKSFLADMAAGKQVSFNQWDAHSIFHHALFCLMAGVSLPLENWGLVSQENGALGLRMVGEGLGHHFLLSSEDPLSLNILLLLPFANQAIPEPVKQDFITHDGSLLLTHWLIALTKLQGNFEERIKQERKASPTSENDRLMHSGWELEFKVSKGRLTKWGTNLQQIKELLAKKDITYLQVWESLHPGGSNLYQFFWTIEGKKQEGKKVGYFLNNILLPTIQGLKNTPLFQETLKEDASVCLTSFEDDPGLSIKDLFAKIGSPSSKFLFLSLYETTKDIPFFEAQCILDDYERLKGIMPQKSTDPQDNLDLLSPIVVDVLPLVDINQPHEQIIDTLARLFQVQSSIGEIDSKKFWKKFCQRIAQSKNASLIRRFFSISPKLLDYLGSKYTSFNRNTVRASIENDEFKMYPSRLSRGQKENQDAETQAADSFYALWGDDAPSLRALVDLFLLPRYSKPSKLSKTMEEMGGYLVSTGFASHSLSSQHAGRSKSSQTGPVPLIVEDGQYYELAWSQHWINNFVSLDPIPAGTREAILNHNIPLLALVWLQHLKTQKLPVTFYPWFIQTFLEKATEMQETLTTKPLSTFPEIIERLWPPIFAILQDQFNTLKEPGEISRHIIDQTKKRLNIITLNTNRIDWDWIPKGGKKNLETILEDWVNQHGPNLSKPDPLKPHLSLAEAAGEVLTYFMVNFANVSYGVEVTEKILAHVAQFGIDGTRTSFHKEVIEQILRTLTNPEPFQKRETTESSFDAQRFLISLYFQCSQDKIGVDADSLKISSVRPPNPDDLAKIISLYPTIKTLDISDNGLKDLTFCQKFLIDAPAKGRSPQPSPSGRLRNLQTLDISRNPLWDPSPLRGTTPIQNIILSHTYIPGGDCFFYLTEWPQGGTSITNHFAVPPTAITSSSPQEERFFPTIHPDDAKGIISFYKNILKNICQDKKNPLFSGGGMTYYKCVLDIVNQMAQNFWHQTLADKEFSPNSKAALPHNEFVKTLSEPIESLFELVQRVFGSIAKGASGNPIIQIPEISRKWLFALENDLPCGIPPQDLICQPGPKYAYSLNDLNILQGTAQDYLDCLKRHWEYLKTDLSYEKELLSKTLESRLPLTLVTLAVNKLAQDFWHEALGMKPAGKPQDLWGILTVNNPIATLEAKKLAFAWAYGLPQGTIRDRFSISNPLTLAISNLAPNHHTLSFLKPFSHLTKLELSHCNLTSAKNLPVLHNLIELDLSHNSLESLWGLYREDNRYFKFSNLKCLNLSHNQIKFRVNEWEDFAKSLQHLWQVDLSYNAIEIAPVMQQTQKTQKIKFNITHNSIPFSELWKLYDFKFFWQRSKEESEAINPKENHHHPIHIFHENGQFFCQIYKNNKRKFKNPWNISSHEDYSIVQRLKGKRIDAPLTLIDKEKQSLVELIVKENAGYLNTAHLRVIPQNVKIINNLK